MTAPVLNTSASPIVSAVPEGATNPAGMTVAALVVNGSITDVDGAVEAIAIEAVNTSLGTWQYSLDGGSSWLTMQADLLNSSTNTLGLLLGPTNLIRLLPFGDLNGSLSSALSFRAWDTSVGSAGQYVTTTPGTGAFSAASDTASLAITAVNDFPTFAPVVGTGMVVTDFGSGTEDAAYSITVQADGKIVAAGYSNSGSGGTNDFALVRYNVDGSLDTSVNGTGKLVIDINSGSDDTGKSVTVQADGKILVAGYSYAGTSYDFTVVRYNPNGSLDTSFGSGTGKVVIDIGGDTEDLAYSVALQSDGKILVAGYSDNTVYLEGAPYYGSNDFCLVRLNVDGSLDDSFNYSEAVLTDFGYASFDIGYDVTVQSDGKILVAGYSNDGSGGSDDFAVARYNADGSPDYSFGDGTGKAVTDFGNGSTDYAYSVTVQADGKIVVVGQSDNGGWNDFAVARYNANGSLDTSFSGDGLLVTDIGIDSYDIGRGVTVQADGKIVVAGYNWNGNDYDFVLVRLNANGTLDTSFNGTGTLVTDIGNGTSDFGRSVSVQTDGKIVVGGESYDGTSYDFVVVRYNIDGSLDTTFNGIATPTMGGSVDYTEQAPAVALDSSVAIFDADLAALSGGAGNYGGASITLSRSGGANAQDLFSGLGSLTLAGASGSALLSGVNIGSFTNAAGTLALTFNSSATQVRVNEALSSFGYANSSNTPPASVVINYGFLDGNSGAQGGSVVFGTTGNVTVNITSVFSNEPPVLNASETPSLGSVLEGATNPAGITVAALVVDGSITDIDGAIEAIAIEAVNTSLGTWQYSLDGGSSWLTMQADLLNSSTNTLGLLLGPANLIRLLPYGDLNGTPASAITFRAWDTSSGVAGQYVVTTPGTGAFSAASDTAGLTVTAVNDGPTFAPVVGTGTVLTDIGASEYAFSVTVQADGKIVVAGISEWDSRLRDFAVVRYNADGSLDTSFNGTGTLVTDIGVGSSDFGKSLTIQPDGKILVAGSIYDGSSNGFAIVRYNTDGSLDTNFNGTGKLVTDIGTGTNDSGYSVTVQPDGKIVVAGYSFSGSSYDFAVVRYNANGSLDTSFNGTGKLVTDIGFITYDYANSVTVQPDGKIVVAGYSSSGSNYDFSVVRYNANGSLDTSFNGTGKLVTDIGIGTSDHAESVTVQPDGKVVVAGWSESGGNSDFNNDFAVVRYNANGSLDTSFNGTGKLVTDIGVGNYDRAYSVTVQPDGKIVVAGESYDGSSYEFAVVRYNANGSLDTTFNGTGKLATDFRVGSYDQGHSVTVQPDGKIVVAGDSNDNSSEFAVVRYNPDGSLDTTFNGTATPTLGGSVAYTEQAAPAALDTSVTIFDADLAALASGAGNYSGASITLSRSGGANAQDLLTGLGNLTLSGASGSALLSGLAIGTFANAAGTLTLTFNSNATQARVNEALSSLGYANSSDAPPANAVINYVFSDGNSSAQGSGGALGTTGSVTVNITPVNDAPTLSGVPATAQAVVEGAPAALADFTVADIDSATLTLTLTAVNGTINGLVDTNTGTPGIQLTGSAASINAAVAAATFTASAEGAASINLSLEDGTASAVTVAYNFTAASSNNTPVLNASATPSLGSVLEGATNPSGITVAALVVNGSITDTDGAVEAIAIEAVDTSLGAWQYSLDGGSSWLTMQADLLNSSTNSLGLLLGPANLIRLLPYGDLNGTLASAVTFRAWDTNSGAAGQYVVTTPGAGAFSAASATAGLTVTAVNDGPTFAPVAGTGKVFTDIGVGTDDVGQSVTVQADGKIVVAGYSQGDFAVVRYNSNGSLDTSFNGTGKLVTDIRVGTSDFGESVTVQPDGKIVVAGYSYSGGANDFAVVRYNANGSLDTSFNGTGKLVTDIGVAYDRGFSVTIQPDGKIVVAGFSDRGSSSSSDLVVMRYNANGSLDTSFNGTGKVVTDIGVGTSDFGESVTVQPDGKIVVAGYSYSGGGYDFAVVRYNANGSLDTSFNGTGKLVTDIGVGPSDFGESVTVQLDGKIVLAGQSYSGSSYDFAVARYNANGSLDTSFNGTGKLMTDIGGTTDERGESVTVQPDGKIVVAGTSQGIFAVVRYNANGSLDTSFNGTGKLVTDIGVGKSVTVQPDGKIVVAGYGDSDGSYDFDDFAVVRYNANGSLDTAFNGISTPTLGGSVAYTEQAPVALDTSVAIFDADLAALVGGAGNYSGAFITMSRAGGANAQDVFSAVGNLILAGASGSALLSGVNIGTFTNAAGTLTLTFNSNATQARVNEALSSLGYANSSDAPPANAVINYVFSDGNSSAQGSGGALGATGSVTVNITALNDAPVAAPVALGSSPEGTLKSISPAQLLAGVTDVDTAPGSLSITAFSIASGGGVLTPNFVLPGWSYTPAADYSGPVTFNYTASDGQLVSSSTASLTIASVNDPPVAAAGAASGPEDTVINGTAAASDIDSTLLTYSLVQQAAHGTVSVNPDGSYSYTPQLNYFGADSFSFKASDGTVDSNVATVALTVTPVNDAPVASTGTASGAEDTVINGTAAASDIDSTLLTYSLVQQAAHGTVSVNPDGSYSYTPQLNYFGADSFSFKASDGTVDSNVATVALTVTPVNDAPVASTGTASGPEDTVINGTAAASDIDSTLLTYSLVQQAAHGTVSVNANGSYSYTPQLNYFGADSFSFKASDGTVDSNVATVTLTVTPVNDAPVASTGTASGPEDTVINGTAAASDIDSTLLTYSLVQQAAHGTVSVNANGSYSYTPQLNYFGADSFSFKASDGTVDSNVATVTLTVTPINDALSGSLNLAGELRQGQTLSLVSFLDDPDGIGPTTVEWLLGGTPIDGATGNSYLLVAADVGSTMSVRISYTDGAGTVERMRSASTETVLVANPAADTAPPTVVAFEPADEATGVRVVSDVVLTFSELITRGSGSVILKTLAGEEIERFDVATSTRLVISGNTLTINPSANLAVDTRYGVEFSPGSIKDLAGNSYTGTTSYNFATAPRLTVGDAIVSVYTGMYNRAPDQEGLSFWQGAVQNQYGLGMDAAVTDLAFQRAMVQAFAQFPTYYVLYKDMSDETFVSQLYVNLQNRSADAGGLGYWVGRINGSIEGADGPDSREKITADFIYGTLSADYESPFFLENFDAPTLAAAQAAQDAARNKIEVAKYYTQVFGELSNYGDIVGSGYFNPNPASPTYEADARALQAWLETQAPYANSTESIAGVTSDYATVATSKALVDTLYEDAAGGQQMAVSLVGVVEG